jgi:two-component system, OmpR family, response regulator ChvI
MLIPVSPGQVTSVTTVPPPVVVATRDAAIGRMIAMALRLEGYGPHLFADAEQALAAMVGEPCAAAVLDLRLGKVDGLTVCQRVRASVPVSSMPIILLLTREDTAFLQARGKGLGANAVLFMPFEIRELLAAVAFGITHSPASLHGRAN